MGRVIPLPPFARREAAGAVAGHGQDASAGMQQTTVSGVTWAYNAAMAEWQRVYPVVSLPNGLSGLAAQFYGDPTRWPEIYNVPQNKAIQGPNPNTGLIPGDTILIPGLAQPGPAPGPTPAPCPTPGPIVPVNDDHPIVKPAAKSWWTPGKAIAVGGVAIVGVGLAIWAATRKKRRRRRK